MATDPSAGIFAEQLWQRYAAPIMRTLLSYEADAQLREDLAQDVFLALLKSAAAIKAAGNEKAYVFRIVHNVAVDHIAYCVNRRTDYADPQYITELQDSQQSSESASLVQQVSQEQQKEQLLKAVQKMSTPNKQVIVLLLEDFDQREIADILQLRDSTVRVRINRAKTELQQLMKQA